jgi:WD40 repeat protein
VAGYLLPALGLPADRVLTRDRFKPGAPVVEQFERAVHDSRYTVVVLTPAYLADEWSTFGEQLASYATVTDGHDRLIPLLLEPCTIPLHVEFRVRLDCTDPARWDQETARLRELVDQPEPVPEELPCPYPGMAPFDASLARFFHGRAGEVSALARRLRHQRFVLVIGPSGSGKSSLVLAGLLPELARREDGRWLVRSLRPGGAPLRSLAAALGGWDDQPVGAAPALAELDRATALLLGQEPPADRLLVVVDQLEEAFTQASEPERSEFLSTLVTLREVNRCAVVATMRADFYPELMTSALWPVDPVERVEVAPLRGAALRQAIERPAQDVGVQLDRGLTERLLADAAGEPGALPLVQETMVLLWQDRTHRLLTQSAYDALGVDGQSGLAVALATRADAALASLAPGLRLIARRIFLRLVQFGEGRDDTRRQQPVAALRAVTEDPELFDRTLTHLTDQRLLIMSSEGAAEARTVDLAHEALITAWPTMRRWIEQARQGLRVQRQLSRDAEEWQALGREPSALIRGVQLAAAREWVGEHADELNVLERAFLDASLVHEASELEVARRANRRLRLLAQGLGTLLVLVVATSVVAVFQSVQARQQRDRAEAQQRRATSRQLAAQAVAASGRQVPRSLLLSLEALRSDDTAEARSALLTSLQASDPHTIAFLQGPSDPIRSLAFSPDGTTLATGSEAGAVQFWDVAHHRSSGGPVVGHHGTIQALAFSPDGRTAASAGFDGRAVLWDPRSRRPLAGTLQVKEQSAQLWSVAFSPDGTSLAAGVTVGSAAGPRGLVVVWDVARRQVLAELPVQVGHTVASLAFSDDGTNLTAGTLEGAVTTWHRLRQPGVPRLAAGGNFSQAALSPDGHILGLAIARGTVELWDVRRRRQLTKPLTGHTGVVEDVAVSADGGRVAAGGVDQKVLVWDVATGQPIGGPLHGHSARLESVAFAPDGRTLASGSDDGTVILWDLDTRPTLGEPLEGHDQPVWSVAFAPDGRMVASGSDDGTAMLWDPSTGRRIGKPLEGEGQVQSVAFTPDGRTLATSGRGGVDLWDVATQRRLTTLTVEGEAVVTAVAFAPNGRTLAAGTGDGSISFWDVAGRQPLGAPQQGHSQLVTAVAFSPDGRTMASSSLDGSILLWDTAGGRRLGELPRRHTGAVQSVAFDPATGELASGHQDGTIQLWDARRRQPVQEPLVAHEGRTYAVAFSRDGQLLASGGQDGTVVLWHADAQEGWRRLDEPLTGHARPVTSVAFGPDGLELASGSWDRTVRVWDLDLASWQKRACAIANRDLSQAERDQFLGQGQPRNPTCPYRSSG